MPTSPMTVAVLGAGGLGAAMTRRLVEVGHDVRLWNRTAEKAREVAADSGASAHDTVAEALTGADALLTVLRDADAVVETLGEHLDGFTGVWVQASTVGPDGARRLGELAAGADVAYLDAPVSGSTQPAEQGALVWLLAGPDDALERARPVLDALGSDVQHVGAGTSEGSALKLAVNAWLASATVAISDTLRLCDGLGVDHDALRTALDAGPLAMAYAEQKSRLMDTDTYTPGFAVENALKDLHLASRAHAPTPLLDAVTARLQRAVDAGHGAEDVAAVHRVD